MKTANFRPKIIGTKGLTRGPKMHQIFSHIFHSPARLHEVEVLATKMCKCLEKRKKVVFNRVDVPVKRGDQSGRSKIGPPGKNVTLEKGCGVCNKVPVPAPVRPALQAETNKHNSNQGPQFQYHSAAEDQTLVCAVMDRVLRYRSESSWLWHLSSGGR